MGHVPSFNNGENLSIVYLSISATLSPETSRTQRAELTLPLNPVCARGIPYAYALQLSGARAPTTDYHNTCSDTTPLHCTLHSDSLTPTAPHTQLIGRTSHTQSTQHKRTNAHTDIHMPTTMIRSPRDIIKPALPMMPGGNAAALSGEYAAETAPLRLELARGPGINKTKRERSSSSPSRLTVGGRRATSAWLARCARGRRPQTRMVPEKADYPQTREPPQGRGRG
jgi:hypothetical protein